jgi:signal transduction histidine kinase
LPRIDDEVGRLAATFDSMLMRLDEAFQREQQFVANASHELRTPLTAMQTIISSTLARPRPPKEYEQALSDLDEEADRMRTMTEGLLLLARNDVPRPEMFETLDLSLLLEDVVESLRPLAEDKGLELICDVPKELILTGDNDGLIRLFVNLLGNAIKYTEQGRVTVSAGQDRNGTVSITVVDTGDGIAPEQLPYIFDRFYRADKSRSTAGVGLGLAIAAEVAHAHSGTIKVDSEIGAGSTFTVQLAQIS